MSIAQFFEVKKVRIEDEVRVPRVTSGRGAMLVAGRVVTGSVPPITMLQGNPARVEMRGRRAHDCKNLIRLMANLS